MTSSINYMRLVTSLGMIVFVGAIIVGGTGAFFNDTETSTGNVFAAGAIDLKIDSVQHYNGMVCAELPNQDGYVWVPEDGGFVLDGDNHAVVTDAFDSQGEWDAFNEANPTQYPQAGVPCTGSWRLADDNGDLPVIGQFWNFDDIKPGDSGENTISIHIDNNDAWLCAAIDNLVDEDNGITEPEAEDPGEDDPLNGDLDEHLEFFAWVDEGSTPGFQGDDDGEGDNIFQDNETVLGSASAEELSSQVWALAEGGDTPIAGGETGYIGLAWCAGSFDNAGNCDGSTMGNEAQTDTWGVDFLFYVEQSRNNDDFSCAEAGLIEPPEPTWTDEGTRTGGSVDFVQDDERGTVLQLTTIDDVDSRVRWSNFSLDVDLDTLIGISFDSKQVTAANPSVGNASMRLFVDLDGDTNTADVQEITYEPYYNIFAHNANGPASIDTGIWQTWPATLAESKFWANGGFLGATPSGGAYATNFTLQQVVDAHANAKIVGISLGMGTYNVDQVVLVDDLLINGSPVSLEN